MTVKELIAKLQTFDQDTLVMVEQSDYTEAWLVDAEFVQTITVRKRKYSEEYDEVIDGTGVEVVSIF